MADLGTLTTTVRPTTGRSVVSTGVFSGAAQTRLYKLGSAVRHMPLPFEAPSIGGLNVAMDKSFSGTVIANGQPVPDCVVRLYHRASGLPLDFARTAANGTYSFHNLYGASEAYFVVAFDPDSGTQYNAVIHDRLTPA